MSLLDLCPDSYKPVKKQSSTLKSSELQRTIKTHLIMYM